jgi:hypothetical protein
VSAPSAGEKIFAQLVRLFAPTLGQTKSEEIIRSTALAFGTAVADLDVHTAKRMLSALSGVDGLIGVAARLATLRFEPPRAREAEPEVSQRLATTQRSRRIGLNLVKALLAPTLGSEKSEQLVSEAVTQLALPDELSEQQALRLFDRLAGMGGLVATAAHFAKARLTMLAPGKTP